MDSLVEPRQPGEWVDIWNGQAFDDHLRRSEGPARVQAYLAALEADLALREQRWRAPKGIKGTIHMLECKGVLVNVLLRVEPSIMKVCKLFALLVWKYGRQPPYPRSYKSDRDLDTGRYAPMRAPNGDHLHPLYLDNRHFPAQELRYRGPGRYTVYKEERERELMAPAFCKNLDWLWVEGLDDEPDAATVNRRVNVLAASVVECPLVKLRVSDMSMLPSSCLQVMTRLRVLELCFIEFSQRDSKALFETLPLLSIEHLTLFCCKLPTSETSYDALSRCTSILYLCVDLCDGFADSGFAALPCLQVLHMVPGETDVSYTPPMRPLALKKCILDFARDMRRRLTKVVDFIARWGTQLCDLELSGSLRTIEQPQNLRNVTQLRLGSWRHAAILDQWAQWGKLQRLTFSHVNMSPEFCASLPQLSTLSSLSFCSSTRPHEWERVCAAMSGLLQLKSLEVGGSSMGLFCVEPRHVEQLQQVLPRLVDLQLHCSEQEWPAVEAACFQFGFRQGHHLRLYVRSAVSGCFALHYTDGLTRKEFDVPSCQ